MSGDRKHVIAGTMIETVTELRDPLETTLGYQLRRASAVMCRSINAQAEFWIKIGMLAEANPTLSFNDIVRQQLAGAQAPAALGAAA